MFYNFYFLNLYEFTVIFQNLTYCSGIELLVLVYNSKPMFMQQGSWEKHIHLVEFTYNNSFHALAPYGALYGRKCRSPSHWDEVWERKLLGTEILQQTRDLIVKIRQRMKIAQDRQKSYADHWRKDLEFEVREKMFVK